MSEAGDPKDKPSDSSASPSARDIEADALLDSLLGDPFPPASAGPRTVAPTQKPPMSLDVPDLGNDDVTVIGRGLNELLAQSFSDSGPPPGPSAPPPQSSLPPEAPRRLSPPPKPSQLPNKAPPLPPRPASPLPPRPASPSPLPPRPAVPRPPAPPRPVAAPLVPRPRSITDPRLEPRAFAPETPVVPPPAATPVAAGFEQEDDEQTRVLRLPGEARAREFAPSSSPSESENLTMRAPEMPLEGASFLDPSGDMPTRPPAPPPEPKVPLAPRVPSIDASFETGGGSERPSAAGSDRPSAAGSDRPSAPGSESARAALRSSIPSVEHLAPSSVPPPALSHGGRSVDPIAREAWIARAEWLETEADAVTDPAAKARALLVASELWALVGDIGRAREVASVAAALARNEGMVGRQLRWLAAREGDWRSVASQLELETRSAATPEARVHAAYLCAEVNRLELDDREASKKKFDLCVRAQADDARAHVHRLLEQLGASGAPAKLRLPDIPELAELTRVSDELGRLRVPGPSSPQPVAAFEEARRALAQGERTRAAASLEKLTEVDGLGRPTRWLAAALSAHEPARRGAAVELLKQLVREDGDENARQALAARSLEASDGEGLALALAGSERFSAADRLALAALSGNLGPDTTALVEEVARDRARAALAAGTALSGRLGAHLDPAPSESAPRAALALGRRLVRPPAERDKALSWLAPAIEGFCNEHPEDALSRALALELSVARRDLLDVATKLLEWPHAAGSDAARDSELAAALAYELGSEGKLAQQAYERALLAAPNSEFATRALMALDAEAAPELVERLAEASAPGTSSSLHFIEAALRRAAELAAAEPLLDKAAHADASLRLVQSIASELADEKNEAERWLSWVRAKREAESDPLELAVDALREVLTLPEASSEARAELIEQALSARPNDATLSDFFERSGEAEDSERARYREAAGMRASGVGKTRWLLEAAHEHERHDNRNEAAALAWRAVEAVSSPLARAIFERLAPGTSDSTRLAEELIARAKETHDPATQRELYDRLFELDRARGAGSPALVWQSAILERSPHYLPALRRLEVAYFSADRRDELEAVEALLAQALRGNDVAPHARLAARLRVAAGNWSGVRPLAELALEHDPNSLWALRALSAQARAADDPATALSVEQKLAEQSTRAADKATLALRAAESAARLGRWEPAQALLEVALEQVPEHLVALTTLAEVLEAREDYAGAARTLEAAAEASRVDAHRVAALYQAGVLWLDRAVQPEPGRIALEQAVLIDLGHEEALARLQSLYVARGDRQKLADLLARRLERTTDPEERIAIEVTRGRALAEVGEPAAARAALSAALDANPDHVEALEAFAEVCLTEGDWLGAEQAFIRLARHAADPARQAQIYRRLGELYDTNIPNPERAELAYQEVLKREPEDEGSVDRLVLVYARMGAKERAVQVQSELLERAKTPEQRRDRTLRLANVLEQVAGEPKRAEATLERARKESPYDAVLLRGLVELHYRSGEARAGQMLLDRAAADARRALATGRFEPALFDVLATVADLRGNTDAAAVAHSALAALAGEDLPVRGAGPAAGELALDELLAPDLMAPSLRALLKRTGDFLDAAFPLDPRTLRATPLESSSAYLSHVQDVARAFGFPSVAVLVSPTLGATCLPAGSAPAVLIFGQALLDSADDAARYCLLVRALKVLQARGSAVARTAPIDLWPMMAALLSLLAPSFTPQAVDARRFTDAKSRIAAALPAELEPDLTSIALEASTVIGNRGSQLATALYQWGNRTALLAVGDTMATLRAIGAATGGQPAPAAGPERVKWIVRNAEARDIAIFGVSEVHAEARRRLGLRS